MTADERFVRSLRDASGSDVSDSAERIAEGAWRRAAEMRSRSRRRFRLLSRGGLVAAAAVVVAVGVYAVRGTSMAFAVEGEPVMLVQEDGRLVPTHEVGPDVLVRVPQSLSVLRWPEGGVVRPKAGSEFRFLVLNGGAAVRLEFAKGGAEVEGARFTVATPDDVIVQRDPAAASFRISVSIDDSGASEVALAEGAAFVRTPRGDDTLRLLPSQRAARLRVMLDGAQRSKLTRIERWSEAAEAQISKGRVKVVDADFGPRGVLMLLGRATEDACIGFEVPSACLADVLHRVNMYARIEVRAECAGADPLVTYDYENAGRKITITVAASGVVRLAEGTDVRTFADMAALRRDAPSIASLFGDCLDR